MSTVVKFDRSNQGHVGELARQLGYPPLVWSSTDESPGNGAPAGFRAIVECRVGDTVFTVPALGAMHPRYTADDRAIAIRRLTMLVADALLDGVARDAPVLGADR